MSPHHRQKHRDRGDTHRGGVALEDLQASADGYGFASPAGHAALWSFHQLGAFIAYKGGRAGVAVIVVDAGLHLTAVLALWACGQAQPA